MGKAKDPDERLRSLESSMTGVKLIGTIAGLLLGAVAVGVYNHGREMGEVTTNVKHLQEDVAWLKKRIEPIPVALKLTAQEGIVSFFKGDKIGLNSNGKESVFEITNGTLFSVNGIDVQRQDFAPKTGDKATIWTNDENDRNARHIELWQKK